jgi:hypothetical protein
VAFCGFLYLIPTFAYERGPPVRDLIAPEFDHPHPTTPTS